MNNDEYHVSCLSTSKHDNIMFQDLHHCLTDCNIWRWKLISLCKFIQGEREESWFSKVGGFQGEWVIYEIVMRFERFLEKKKQKFQLPLKIHKRWMRERERESRKGRWWWCGGRKDHIEITGRGIKLDDKRLREANNTVFVIQMQSMDQCQYVDIYTQSI